MPYQFGKSVRFRSRKAFAFVDQILVARCIRAGDQVDADGGRGPAEIGGRKLVKDHRGDVRRHDVLRRLSVLNDFGRNKISCGDCHTTTQVEPVETVTVTPVFTDTGPADKPL